MSKLFGKIAVVTGGAGGLGSSVSIRLLKEGASVTILHSGSESSKRFFQQITQDFPTSEQAVVDVTSEEEVNNFFDKFTAQHHRLDILCNLVGGIGKKSPLEEVALTEWNKMISLNLHSCFLMMRGSLKLMKTTGSGRIINIAAIPAIRPDGYRGGYGVAKAGVIHLTTMVAEEIKDYKEITINAIAPSIIATEENKKWGTPEDVSRWVTPGQIAEMITYLSSSDGVAVNGQIFQMNGKV